MCDVEARLQKVVVKYNAILPFGGTAREPVTLEAVKQGDYPWMYSEVTESGQGLPFRAKLKICEAWQWTLRCQEQIQITLAEMDEYKMYYEQLMAVSSADLGCMDVGRIPSVLSNIPQEHLSWNVQSMSDMQGWYAGLRALLMSGNMFAHQQLVAGDKRFREAAGHSYSPGTHFHFYDDD